MDHETDDNLRLVPKPGKTKEFLIAMANMERMGKSSIGWEGHASLLYEIGAADAIANLPKNLTKTEAIAQLKQLLIDSYLSTLYEHGEWLPKEQAEKRVAAEMVLFGT